MQISEMLLKSLLFLVAMSFKSSYGIDEDDEYALQRRLPRELRRPRGDRVHMLSFVHDDLLEAFQVNASGEIFEAEATQSTSGPPPPDVRCNGPRETVKAGYYKRLRSLSYPRNAPKASA